jgi:excisionase family DNA binding protein
MNSYSQSDQFLSIAQVARQLAVHPSTIRRWIDQGKLPAYRLGPKRIAIKQGDVSRVLAPRESQRPDTSERWVSGMPSVPRLTVEEAERGLRALDELRRVRMAEVTKHGLVTPPSWVLLEEARAQRTRELMGDCEE